VREGLLAEARCSVCSCVEFLGEDGAPFCARCGHPRGVHARTGACGECDCPELLGDDGARFCARCGHSAESHGDEPSAPTSARACSRCDCGDLLGEDGARFCARCGHPSDDHGVATELVPAADAKAELPERPPTATVDVPVATPTDDGVPSVSHEGCQRCDCGGMKGEEGARFCARCGHPSAVHFGPPAGAIAPPLANEFVSPPVEGSDAPTPKQVPHGRQGPSAETDQPADAPDPYGRVDAATPPPSLSAQSFVPPAAPDQAPLSAPSSVAGTVGEADGGDETPVAITTQQVDTTVPSSRSAAATPASIRVREPERGRRAPYLIGAGLVMLLLLGGGMAILLHRDSSSGERPSAAAPATSPKPPSFAPSVSVTAHVRSRPGFAATPAKNGGLWYQTQTGNLTRLDDTGHVAYTFSTKQPALGLAVTGRTLVVLTQSALTERDRGTGRTQRVVSLPSVPVCCDPVEAGGAFWVPLSSGLARVDMTTGSIAVQPVTSVTDLASDGTRLWALAGDAVVAVNLDRNSVGSPVDLGSFHARSIAVGAGALWAIGVDGGRPEALRVDADTGQRELRIPLPRTATAITVNDGAVWLAIPGLGIQELDPSTNHLAGSPVAAAHPMSLLPASNHLLWIEQFHHRTTTFRRLDLHPTGE
jgi:hypothetical protein